MNGTNSIAKNIQNIGGGSLTLGTTPAYTNINMASNSLSNLKQINGQTFPPAPGVVGAFLSISGDGKTLYWVTGLGTAGPTGATGPTGPIAGKYNQIAYNSNGFAAGATGLTYDYISGITTISSAHVLGDMAVGGTIGISGVVFSNLQYTIAGVQLSDGAISNSDSTSNNIGGIELSNGVITIGQIVIGQGGAISTSFSNYNDIGGVAFANGSISNTSWVGSTIEGTTLINSTVGIGITPSIYTLDVSGNAHFSSDVVFDGNGVIQNLSAINFSVSDTTVLGTTVISNLSVTQTFNVTGSNLSKISNSLNVSGDIQTTDLTLTGASLSAPSAAAAFATGVFTGTLSAGGNTTLNNTTLSSATINHNLTICGNIINASNATATFSAATILGNLTVDGTLNLIGGSTNGNFNIGGSSSSTDTVVSNILDVYGVTNLSGNVSCSNDVSISGTLYAYKLQTTNNVTLCGLNLTATNTTATLSALMINNSLSGNSAAFSSNIKSGTLTVGNTLASVPITTIFTVCGGGLLTGDLTVNGGMSISGTTTLSTGNVSYGFTVGGLASMSAAFVSNTLTVGSQLRTYNLAVSNNLTLLGSLSAAGGSAAFGDITADNLTLNGTLLNAEGVSAYLSNLTVSTQTNGTSAVFSSNVQASAVLIFSGGSAPFLPDNTVLFANGNTSMWGALSVSDTIVGSNGATLYGTTISGDLQVSGRSTFSDIVTISAAALNATGTTTLSATIINNSLTIQGVKSTLSASGTAASLKSLTLYGGLTISSGATSYFSDVNVSGGLTVTDTATLSAAVISNNLTVVGLGIIPSISGLTSLNDMPVVINPDNQQICIGVGATPNSGATSINALGLSAAHGSTGSYVNAFGYGAASGNTSNFINAIGYNAGSNNAGSNLNAIGYGAGVGNTGDSNVSIGDNAGFNMSGDSNIAVGIYSLCNSGDNLSIGVGYKAGAGTVTGNGQGSIYIGQSAGLSNTKSNSIFIGSNPGYTDPTGLHTDMFMIYSTISTTPFIHGDLSKRIVGIGKVPVFAMDVSGTVQASNVSLGALNGLTWPTGTPTVNNVLTYTGSSTAMWMPGAGSASAWSEYPALQAVNISGYDLTGVTTINTQPFILNGQIGIGSDLGGNGGIQTIAIGTAAGTGALSARSIFIGSNPGYTVTSNNTFVVYSTSSTDPFLQGNLNSNRLGVGKIPASELDVSGTINATNITTTSAGGTNQVGPITTTNFNVGIGTQSPNYDLDVNGQINACNITTDLAHTSSIGGVTFSNHEIGATTAHVTNIVTLGSINSTQINIDKHSNINFGSIPDLNGYRIISMGVSAALGTAPFVTDVNAFGQQAACYNAGTNINAIGLAAAMNNSGSFVNAIGNSAAVANVGLRVNAIGDQSAYNNTGSYVNVTGYQSGYANTGNSLNAAGTGSAYSNTGDFMNAFGCDAGAENSGKNVNAIGANSAFSNSASNVNAVGPWAACSNTGTDVNALGCNAGSNNTGSFVNALGNQAALNNTGSYVDTVGYNAANGGTGSYVVAIGCQAGMNNQNSNCVFIGNNPGYTEPYANSFTVYSTNSRTAFLQGDASNNLLGVGCTPQYPLDVVGSIRSTSNVISTLKVSSVNVNSLTLGSSSLCTYYSVVYSSTSNFTINLPISDPAAGSYWVVKNNSTVNYTVTYVNGTLNVIGGQTTSFLQAGNGVTLIAAGSNSVYYTF